MKRLLLLTVGKLNLKPVFRRKLLRHLPKGRNHQRRLAARLGPDKANVNLTLLANGWMRKIGRAVAVAADLRESKTAEKVQRRQFGLTLRTMGVEDTMRRGKEIACQLRTARATKLGYSRLVAGGAGVTDAMKTCLDERFAPENTDHGEERQGESGRDRQGAPRPKVNVMPEKHLHREEFGRLAGVSKCHLAGSAHRFVPTVVHQKADQSNTTGK
ncbi:MAG: hypothetical protein WBL72_14545 [Thermoguttaceae bacterium]